MILELLKLFFPQTRLIMPPPPKKPTQKKVEEKTQKIAFEDCFSKWNSFTHATNLKGENKGNWTKIRYDVDNFEPLFNTNEVCYQIQFRDQTILPVAHQFFIDLNRASDKGGIVCVGKEKVHVQRSEPHLVWNEKDTRWHFESDLPGNSYTDTKIIYRAPLILEKLRKLTGDDAERFRLLTTILTQTPFNDMFGTVQAHIIRQYDATMMNGGGEAPEDFIQRPRYRAYRLDVDPSQNKCIVTAIIVGKFTGCAVETTPEMIEGFPQNEVGWYRCLTSYDLVTMKAQVEIQYVAYPENWKK